MNLKQYSIRLLNEAKQRKEHAEAMLNHAPSQDIAMIDYAIMLMNTANAEIDFIMNREQTDIYM